MLEPGESEDFQVKIPLRELASYDDKERFSYILESGVYSFYLGSDVRSAEKCGEFALDEDLITEELTQCAAPDTQFLRLVNDAGKIKYEQAPMRKNSLKDKISANLPPAPGVSYIKKCTLKDVKEGKKDGKLAP